MEAPFNANEVIADLAEQVKQLSLNNTLLRAMLKKAKEDLASIMANNPPVEEG